MNNHCLCYDILNQQNLRYVKRERLLLSLHERRCVVTAVNGMSNLERIAGGLMVQSERGTFVNSYSEPIIGSNG